MKLKPKGSILTILQNMWYQVRFLLLFISTLSILAACKKDKQAVADGPSVIKLYNCNGNKNSSTPYICFDSLVTDSRCPANVNCIWSGYATIKVRFHENGNIHAFKMVTPLRKFDGGVNDTTINGYHVILKSLDPYPGTNSGNDIKATIEITN